MIPKKIHYCWLSGEEFPPMIANCIDSWKRHMPDYEFVLWDTNKFDVNSVLYVKQAYEVKKYAFASDYIRLFALYTEGGIYLDSDIQVFKRFDDLLEREGFTGFESNEDIAAWIFASEAGNPLFKELMDYYNDKSLIMPDGSIDMTPNVFPVTQTLLLHGLTLNNTQQELDHITVFPRTYFCPMIPNSKVEECYTENTYCQHLFNAGWIDTEQKELVARRHRIDDKYGKIVGLVYYGLATIKKDGFRSFFRQWKQRIEKKSRRTHE